VDNAGLGIDLNYDGVTPNTQAPPFFAANDAVNAPVLTTVATKANGDRIVDGYVEGGLLSGLRVEFYANRAYDPTGSGEGEFPLGSMAVSPNGDGRATFSFTYTPVPGAPFLTAILAEEVVFAPKPSTSEFSSRNLAPQPSDPGSQNTFADTPLIFAAAKGNVVSITDPNNSGTTPVTITLAVQHGTLKLLAAKGAIVKNNRTGSITATGTPAALNAALRRLIYTPVAGFTGLDTLNITAVDNAPAELGGPATSSTGIPINVRASHDVVHSADDPGGNGAGNGQPDAFRLVRAGSSLQVYLDGNLSQSFVFAQLGRITVQGSTDADTLTVDFDGGNPVPAAGLTYDGGANNGPDVLRVTGRQRFLSTAYTATGPGAGTLAFPRRVALNFIGLENVLVEAPSATVSVTVADGNSHTGTFSDAGTPGMTTVGFDGGLAALTFANPTVQLTVNGDDTGNDVLRFTSLGTGFQAGLTVAGRGGFDMVDLDTALTLGSGFSNRNLVVNAEDIEISARLETQRGSILLSADRMDLQGSLGAAHGTVTLQPLTPGQMISLGGADTAGVLGLTAAELRSIATPRLTIGSLFGGRMTVAASIDLTGLVTTLHLVTGANIIDDNTPDIDLKAARITLAAQSGIGTPSNPLEIHAARFRARSRRFGAFVQNLRT
jgi:hypothetical protein